MERYDPEKIRLLYELYEQPMYRIAFAVLRESGLAEDAVQDAFVKLMSKPRRLGEPDSPETKAYIVRVIKSTSISIYRRSRRRAAFEQEIDEQTVQIPDRRASLFAEKAYIPEGISSTDSRIITLRCEYGLPWKDVAEKVGLKEPAVRKRFERTRKKLIGMKGEYHEEG